MIKILTDENVHSDIVAGLIKSGYDTVTVTQLGLAGNTDERVLIRSKKENRILLTGDKDFGGLLEFGPLCGQGKVILLRYRIINTDRIFFELEKTLKTYHNIMEETSSLVVVLSEGQCRLHRFT